MSLQEIRRYDDELRAGRTSPATVIDAVLPHVRNEARPIRRAALETLLEAASREPARTTDIVDALLERLADDAYVSDPELELLRDLAGIRARECQPLVEYLTSVIVNREAHATDPKLAVGVLGEIGADAPGVVKPALEALFGFLGSADEQLRREAMWAIVRTVESEPAVVRPLIAGRVWALDDEDPTTVRKALEDLGRIGWILPDRLVAVDRIAEFAAHPLPDVRETAVDALARIGGVSLGAVSFGRPSPEHAEATTPDVFARLGDSNDDVQLAAIKALRWWAEADPSLLDGRIDRLVRLAEHDRHEIRSHTLRLLVDVYDAGFVDDTDAERLERLFVRSLTDPYEGIRPVAMDGLKAAIDRLKTDPASRGRERTLAELVIWQHLVVLSEEPTLIDEEIPLEGSVLVELCDVETLCEVIIDACVRDCDESVDSVHGIDILGRILKHAETPRWEALAWLTERLGSDRSATRAAAAQAIENAAGSSGRVADAFGEVLLTQLAYDPKTRNEIGDAIVAAGAHDAALVAKAIRLCLRAPVVDDDEPEEGMDVIVAEALDDQYSETLDEQLIKFAYERPSGAAEALDALVDGLTADDPQVTAAIGLANGVAAGGSLSASHGRRIRRLLTDDDGSPVLKAWTATALLVGGADAESRRLAEAVLRSLFKRRDHDGIEEPLELLGANRPRLAAKLLESVHHTELDADRKAAIEALVSPDPHVIPSLRWYTPFFEPITADGSEFAVRLAETAPHAVRSDSLLAEPVAWDDTETLLSVIDTIDPAFVADECADGAAVDFDSWERYPVVEVRTRLDELRERSNTPRDGEAAEYDEHVPSTAREVDALAGRLRSGSEATVRTVCHRLVETAVAAPEYHERVVSHLLVYVTTARATASRSIAVSALATLAPASLPDVADETDDQSVGARVVGSYCRSESEIVRRAAVDALVEIHPSPPVDVLRESIADEDVLVRARGMRALERHSPQAVGDVLETVRASLHGQQLVAAAACEAIGRYAETGAGFELETLNAVRGQLTAEHRGVRRAAATALERIARHDTDAARRLSETLFGRLRIDTASRRELVRAIQTIPVVDIDPVNVAAEQLTLALFETSFSDASHAAGEVLRRLVAEHPLEAGSHVRKVGAERIDATEGFDEPIAHSLSEYYLFESLTLCCEHSPTLVDPFEPLVRKRATGEPETFVRPPDVDPPRRSAAMRVAAHRGFDCYQRVLDSYLGDDDSPPVGVDDVAVFLGTVGGDEQEEALETVLESVATADVDHLVEALADLDVDRADPTAILRALGALLPETDSKSVQRTGIDVHLEHRTAAQWYTRRTVARTMRELGAAGILLPEEAIAHLLFFLDDRDRRVRETAAEGIASLVRRSCLEPTWLIDDHRRLAVDSRADPARRSGSIAVLGAVARRWPTVHPAALDALVAVLERSPARHRRDALDQLEALAETAPSAVEGLDVEPDGIDLESPTGGETGS